MHDTGCLRLVHWDDPEGWNGEGGGRTRVYLWQIHVDIWQNEYNIIKLKIKKNKNLKKKNQFGGFLNTLKVVDTSWDIQT